jgi:hypothetical protein
VIKTNIKIKLNDQNKSRNLLDLGYTESLYHKVNVLNQPTKKYAADLLKLKHPQ